MPKKKNEIKTIDSEEQLKDLETFFVNGTVENMVEKLDVLKEIKVNQMIEYANNHKKPLFDKYGEIVDYVTIMNPLVVNNIVFKSISPLGSKVPNYNAEKLALIFEYYLYLITEINDKIGDFPSSLASFCKLAGISTKDLRMYRNSSDLDMRNIVEKIYDEIGDNNLFMAQLGKLKGTPTQFKLKTQNEMVEKANPNVNITYKEVVNTSRIEQNIEKYKSLLNR